MIHTYLKDTLPVLFPCSTGILAAVSSTQSFPKSAEGGECLQDAPPNIYLIHHLTPPILSSDTYFWSFGSDENADIRNLRVTTTFVFAHPYEVPVSCFKRLDNKAKG